MLIAQRVKDEIVSSKRKKRKGDIGIYSVGGYVC